MLINIKGKDVKFGFGLYFLGKAMKNQDTDLQGILTSISKHPIADMVDLMYFSAKCEAELDNVELQISKRDFLEHLEATNDFKNTDGLLAEWANKFTESLKGNFLPENEEEQTANDEKKN